MSDRVRLSRSAKRLLFLLCEHYNTRIRYGTSEEEACIFGGAQQLIDRLGLSDSPANVSSWARELAKAEMISALFEDNGLAESELSPEGVAYYESRFDDLKKLFPDAISLAGSLFSLLG